MVAAAGREHVGSFVDAGIDLLLARRFFSCMNRAKLSESGIQTAVLRVRVHIRPKDGNGNGNGSVKAYRHEEANRKSNPPAKIAAEGIVPAMPEARYAYNPHRPPALRFDPAGSPDKLPELLEDARRSAALDQPLEGKLQAQKSIKALEKTRSAKRRELFDAQDAIDEKRDEPIEGTERQLKHTRAVQTLFTIRWEVR